MLKSLDSLLSFIPSEFCENFIDGLWSRKLGFTKFGGLVVYPLFAALDFAISDYSMDAARNAAVGNIPHALFFSSMDFFKQTSVLFGGLHPWLLGNKSLFIYSKSEHSVGSKDYVGDVIKNLKEHKGLKGNYRVSEIKPFSSVREGGAGAYRGDHVLEVTVKKSVFDKIIDRVFGDVSAKEAKFIHKRTNKHKPGNLEREGLITSLLSNCGFGITPEVYSSPKRYEHDRFLTQKLNVGTSYEKVEGSSLEELIYERTSEGWYISNGPKAEHLSPKFADTVDDIMGLMFRMYGHPDFRGNSLDKLLLSDAIFRCPKGNKVEVKFGGDDYTLMSDATIADKVRDAATNHVGFDAKAPRFTFHKSLVEKLSKHDEEFSSYLHATFVRDFSKIEPTLIHGDFHPGNLLVRDEDYSPVVIDWDNARLGVPYEDFFYFSVVSGFENNPGFSKSREGFLERQNEAFGCVPEEANTLIEFETYMSLLDRYYTALETGQIVDDCHGNMLNSCVYLLHKSDNALEKYLSIRPDSDLRDKFGQFVAERYDEFAHMEESSDHMFRNQEVPFAHTANYGMRKHARFIRESENIEEHWDLMVNVERVQQKVIGMHYFAPIATCVGLTLFGASPFAEELAPYFSDGSIQNESDVAGLRHSLRSFGCAAAVAGISGFGSIMLQKRRLNKLNDK